MRPPVSSIALRRIGLSRSGLGDLAALDALGAQTHALRVALAVRNARIVQIRKEAALRDAGRVQADAAFVLVRTLADDRTARRRSLFRRHSKFPALPLMAVPLKVDPIPAHLNAAGKKVRHTAHPGRPDPFPLRLHQP